MLLATVALAAVVAAPALAQTSKDAPDYVLEEDGTVVIDGDGATDCRSFASFLEEGYFESGDISPGAQLVLEQCEEAEGLPDTGGPNFPSLLPVVSSALAVTGALLAGKVAMG